MRTAIRSFMLVLAFAPAALAQTVTTNNNAYLYGIVNCRFLKVEVHQKQEAGGTITTLGYAVQECPSGSSQPTTVVLQGLVTIPNADYRVQTANGSAQQTLSTRTKDGLVQVTWRAVDYTQSTFSSTSTNRENGGPLTRTTQQHFYSTATAEGSIAGFTITPEFSSRMWPAWISAETTTTR